MFSLQLNHKFILMLGLVFSLVCSLSVTFASENNISDGVSITSSIFLGFGIMLAFLSVILEVLESICNP